MVVYSTNINKTNNHLSSYLNSLNTKTTTTYDFDIFKLFVFPTLWHVFAKTNVDCSRYSKMNTFNLVWCYITKTEEKLKCYLLPFIL
jgi:hypothetical protein